MTDSRQITKAEETQPERAAQRRAIAPPVDVYENDDELLVVMDLPGVRQEDLTIGFDKDRLTIEAARVGESRSYLFQEFHTADVDYRRSFEVAPGFDVDKVSAELKSGVLSVHLPKSTKLKPRRIPISGG